MTFEQRPEQKVKRTARVNGAVIDVDRLIASMSEFTDSAIPAGELLDFRSHDRGWSTASGETIGPKHIIDLAEACHADYDQMIATQPGWEEHIHRVRGGDLDIPILITEDGAIIDGAHRITKMFVEHRDTIRGKRVSKEILSTFLA